MNGMDGKFNGMTSEGKCDILGFVRQNNLQDKNVLLLVFGTVIETGLYINGAVVKDADIGLLLEPEYSTDLQTSDAPKLVKELLKIKNSLSLDEVYASGFISKHKDCTEMLKEHGINVVDSYFDTRDGLQNSTKEQHGKKYTIIMAEIGYNHQGDVNTAKELIRRCKEAGVDVVKLQKHDLGPDGRFTPQTLKRPYESRNSFGATYGEHRAALELSKADFKALQCYAKEIGVLFTASGQDKPSFDFLNSLDVPFFKIGSGDIGNLALIEHIAKKHKPIVLSTGTADMATVEKSVNAVLKHNQELTLLQCTSCYPLSDDEANLNVVRTYQRRFPHIKIGYSGHDQGTPLTLAAVALGAVVVERHVTLDKQMKGSDHIASLDMNELATLVRDIRRIDSALGTGIKCIQPSEEAFMKKLSKRLVYARSFEKGSVITPDDIVAKVSFATDDDVPIVDTEWESRELLADVAQNENVETRHFRNMSAVSDSGVKILNGNSAQCPTFVK